MANPNTKKHKKFVSPVLIMLGGLFFIIPTLFTLFTGWALTSQPQVFFIILGFTFLMAALYKYFKN